MFHKDSNAAQDRFTRGIIRRKVRQLTTRAGFSPQDHEDLEQDLLVRVLESQPYFHPARAHRNRFITAVVERHVANILRDRTVGKRDSRGTCSLSVTIEVRGEGAIELAETVSQRELYARLGRRPRSEAELTQLAADVATVMATLPDGLRNLAERLKTQSIAEVARAWGIPRTTLYESIRHLRRRFERAGLKNYL